ncbi:MAG: caspase family protein, partial [Staphylococcus sp.]|nr:caspase family protein [Staphylococcus sp.]
MSRKALVVGIDDYPGCPLNGCVNDAKEIKSLLEINGDGSPNFEVKYAPNIQTKDELLDLLNALFCEGDSDISLFYFSGHGTDEFTGKIVTPDFKGRDMGVSMSDILALLKQSKSKNKVVILDCCFSGKFGELEVVSSNETVLGEGVTIMTASSRDQYAVEDGITGHGVFTELLIQGLLGGAADVGGNITPASLYSFVDQSLGAWEQRPLFKTNISRFLPIRKIKPKVPIEVLRKFSYYFQNPDSEYSLDPSFEFTNNPEYEIEIKEPYAKDENV